MDILKKLSEEFRVRNSQVEQTVKLIDEGNTIPFIARYRKEATGGLSDEVLRDINERLTYLRNLEERKEEVIRLIDEQGKLTEELRQQIAGAVFFLQGCKHRQGIFTVCNALQMIDIKEGFQLYIYNVRPFLTAFFI